MVFNLVLYCKGEAAQSAVQYEMNCTCIQASEEANCCFKWWLNIAIFLGVSRLLKTLDSQYIDTQEIIDHIDSALIQANDVMRTHEKREGKELDESQGLAILFYIEGMIIAIDVVT